MRNAPLNALYTSWGIQNSIIKLCGERILRTLVAVITKARYFSLLADETSHVERVEQLSICIRYGSVTEGGVGEVREDFLGFVEALDLRARSLAELLLQTMAKSYDGAANMSGKLNGVQAAILEDYPKACYTHCSSHCLNPVISTACANNAMKKTVEIFKTSSTFSAAARSELAC